MRLTVQRLSLNLPSHELTETLVKSIPKDTQVFNWQCRHEYVVAEGDASLQQPENKVRQRNI